MFKVIYSNTKFHVAYIFTKPLKGERFRELRTLLCIVLVED